MKCDGLNGGVRNSFQQHVPTPHREANKDSFDEHVCEEHVCL